MAENHETPKADASDQVEPKTNFVTKFVNRYPRTAKVLAITGGIATALAVGTVANTVVKNRSHLELAADHAKESLHELSDAVSPTDTDV